jgi:creatine kinase
MWNDTLGFMGTCPTNLGTGLRASVMITLEAFNRLYESPNHADKELLETVCKWVLMILYNEWASL